MKTWRRLTHEVRCGRCGESIYPNQPILVYKFKAMRRQFYRCVECEGPAPPDLPVAPILNNNPPKQGFQRLSREWLPYNDH